jgi:hypothetical protein
VSTANPEPYDEKIRLAEIIADARKLLARVNSTPTADLGPSDIGEMEAMLRMLADSAAAALRLSEPAPEQEISR